MVVLLKDYSLDYIPNFENSSSLISLLERHLINVLKPGRYTGGEYNQIKRLGIE